MVKLVWQLGAWALAFYGIYLWTTADPATLPVASYLIRDGLLVVISALLIALGQSVAVPLTRTRPLVEQLTSRGQIMLWTGAICALIGSLLDGPPVVIGATPLFSSTMLWWAGLVLLTTGMLWPEAWRNKRHPQFVIAPSPERSRKQTASTQPNDALLTNADHPTPSSANTPPAGRSTHVEALPEPATSGVNWLSLLLVLLLGGGIRWLLASRLSAFCQGTACEAALQISEGTATSFPLIIAQWANQWLDQELLSVRLIATVLALVGVLCFYLATRRLVNAGSAFLGTLMLMTTPWLYTLDAGSLPALTLFFWTTIACWLLLTAWQRQTPRWALLAGVALGFATASPLLQGGLLLWLLLLPLLTILLPKGDLSRLLTGGLALLGFLLSALPTFLQQGGLAALEERVFALLPFTGAEAVIALLQPGLATLSQPSVSQWSSIAPLTILLGGATVAGLGYLLRNSRDPLAVWLMSGWLIVALLFRYSANHASITETLTLLFLCSMLVATVALHVLFATFVRQWQRIISPANAVAVAALLLVLPAYTPLRTLWDQSGQSRTASQSMAEQAMITHIDELLAITPDLTIFAPTSLLENPATRLHLNEAMLTQIQPLAAILNTRYTSDELHDIAYFIPLGAHSYGDLVQRMQPGITREQQLDPQSGELLYTLFRVSAAEQAAQQGLLGVAWEQMADGSTGSQGLPTFGPLQLEPELLPALQPPFSLQWTGALRVPAPGTYRFTLDLPPPIQSMAQSTAQSTADAGQQATISLELDNRLILDSVLGLAEQEIMLVKGFYQLTLILHSSRLPDDTPSTTDNGQDTGNETTIHNGLTNNPVPLPAFAIRWQRPDGRTEIVPRQLLYNIPLGNNGLIGEYYTAGTLDGAPFDIRKDPVVGLADALAGAREEAYAVRWRGQFAAPRTGEYLLAALSAPPSSTRLSLDGVQLFDTALESISPTTNPPTTNPPPLPSSAAAAGNSDIVQSSYAEGTVYLEQGWHTIVVEHTPDMAAPAMQLFWQPPGSGPALLDASYLAPSLTTLTVADRQFPVPPPLSPEADAAIGVESSNNPNAFALSYGTAYWAPQVQLPPAALPTVPFEEMWRVGSCGSGDEQLAQPHGVALNASRGRLYVADTGNRRVIEYTLDGALSRVYTNAEWQEPVDVALLPKETPAEEFVVVLDATMQSLTNLDPTTGVLERRPVQTGFYYPRGLAVDALGNVLVADTGGGRVARLLPDGNLYESLGGPETRLGKGQPTDVVEVGGMLWAVTAEDGRLWQPVRGGSYTAIERTNTMNGPHLAGLPDGTIFLSDPVRHIVLYLAATGEPQAAVQLPGLIEPTGIAVADMGNLLYLAVTDTAGCQLSLWRTDATRR